MAKTEQVTIGGFSFTAHKFTFGEVEDISEWVDRLSAATGRERFVCMRGIVLVSINRDNPTFTDDMLKNLEVSLVEFQEAVQKVLRVGGVLAKVSATPGEEGAATPKAAAAAKTKA